MTRYKDYIIPLSVLRSNRLAEQIAAAGAPIFDKKRSDTQVQADVVSILKHAEEDASAAVQKSKPEAADIETTEEVEVVLPKKRKPAKHRFTAKTTEAERELIEAALHGNYVKLTDVLPPVPSKGNFDVNTIRKSLYFFS